MKSILALGNNEKYTVLPEGGSIDDLKGHIAGSANP